MEPSKKNIRNPVILLLLSLIQIVGLTTTAQGSLPNDSLHGTDLISKKDIQLKFDQAQKGTVVLFLSAHCPCSTSHEQVLKNLFEKFHPKGFQFIAVHSNQDENNAETIEHFTKVEFPFPVLEDKGAKLANQLKALKTPHAYVISKEGDVLFQGGVDDSHTAQTAKRHYLSDALLQLIEGKKPDPAQVRVLGCAIQR